MANANLMRADALLAEQFLRRYVSERQQPRKSRRSCEAKSPCRCATLLKECAFTCRASRRTTLLPTLTGWETPSLQGGEQSLLRRVQAAKNPETTRRKPCD